MENVSEQPPTKPDFGVPDPQLVLHDLNCKRCGQPFKDINPRKRFCSNPKCTKQGKQALRRKRRERKYYKANQGLLRAYRSKRRDARRLLMLELTAQCALCPTQAPIPQMDVDHIDGDPFNDDRKNLRWLCLPCNQKQKALRLKDESEKEMREDINQM